MFPLLLWFAVFLCGLHFYFKYNKDVRSVRQLPIPEEHFLIGNVLTIILSPVELFKTARKLANRFKDRYAWYAFSLMSVNIYNPDDIETVVSGTKHTEKSLTYDFVKPWLREGLLISKDAKWQQRRKILTPAFHFNILKRYYVGLKENSRRLVKTLASTNGESIDIIPIISEYTLNSICETAMGTQLHGSAEGKKYKDTIYKVCHLMVKRFTRVYLFSDFLFKLSSIGRDTFKQLNIAQSFTKSIIDNRKEAMRKNEIIFPDDNDDNGDDDDDDIEFVRKRKKTAMLDLLILAQKDGMIDDAGIQEEVDTFMFEGHDTTASGLVHCLMLLANHKDIQDKITSEIETVFGDSSRDPTLEDLAQLKYLECCIKESLRLYPPVPFIGRCLSEPTQIGGVTINKGIYCHIHIYDLHRREDLYKNAQVFDPDRFLPENSIGRHPYAYIPFSAGPRNCIGQRFAMMEMKSCVAAILRKYELHPVTAPDDIEFIVDLVLRDNNPVYVRFVERV